MSKVISLCDHFDGIFLSKFAFDLYTLVGLKDNKFKILSFENFRFSQIGFRDIYQQIGKYSKVNDLVRLQTESSRYAEPIVHKIDRLD